MSKYVKIHKYKLMKQKAKDRQLRITELEAVLTKLNNIGGLGLDKHKWIEEALKGGAE